jgi:hypothetical protein
LRKRTHPFLFLPIFVVLLLLVIFIYIIFIGALINRNVVIEAGSTIPEAARFINNVSYGCQYTAGAAGADSKVPGEYPLQISINKRKFNVTLTVVDTKAPVASPSNQEVWQGEILEPAQFVINPSDATVITYTFKTQPDFNQPGQQNVIVILTDTSGNMTYVTASLNILADDEAPVIAGAADQSVFIGEPISYKNGVTVADNYDPEVKLVIDNSAVNLAAAGAYPVIYSATDSSGNKAEVKVTITVKAKPAGYVSEQDLNVLIDDVFSDILKPGMSDLERISEIFYWIADHIDYTGTSDKSDWIKAAYLGITRGTGDCYNYYATARAMLTRAGYECISIERVPNAKTHHYWNLVKYNGEYYHFDPMPQLKYYHYVCLLRTDAEVADYTANVQAKFYEFNHDGIPASATVPLDIERKLIYE